MDAGLPLNEIAGGAAYSTDRSSAATVSNVLGILAGSYTFDGNFYTSVGYSSGLYTDELQNINPGDPGNVAFYSNKVLQLYTGSNWTNWYAALYKINLTIEGVSEATGLSHKDQWLGEAHFLRALLHFYLVNLYGDVMISKTSDYMVNRYLGRSPIADVYKQIISDLILAQAELGTDFKDASGTATISRARPNQYAATALLAKAYLYTENWANAELEATKIIGGAESKFTLLPAADIDKVFLTGSTETIFALEPEVIVLDFYAYTGTMPAILPANSDWTSDGVFAALSNNMVSAFEMNPITLQPDRRKTYWTRSTTRVASATARGETIYFPFKYKSGTPGDENIVLLRLAEQYLIRSEARARLNNIAAAKADLNVIRSRAGLPNTTAVSVAELVTAVLQEKRIELFTEQGNRLFDLRRSGTLDAVMSVIAPAKGVGATWSSFKQYYPISTYDISVNPNLIQTPGY